MNRPIRWIAPWTLEVLDQTRLPFAVEWVSLRTADDCRSAIVTMQARGAPLIGAVGAFGLAYALREIADASGAIHGSTVGCEEYHTTPPVPPLRS